MNRDQLGHDCSVYETSCVSKVRGWECGEGSGGKRHQEGICGPRVSVLDVRYEKSWDFRVIPRCLAWVTWVGVTHKDRE